MARSGSGGPANILRRPSPGERRAQTGPIQFMGEVVSELKKVTWPTRQETTRLTILVIAVSASIGVALGLIDFLLTKLLNKILF